MVVNKVQEEVGKLRRMTEERQKLVAVNIAPLEVGSWNCTDAIIGVDGHAVGFAVHPVGKSEKLRQRRPFKS